MADDPAESFSSTSRIRYDECGADGAARASVYIRLLQELAFDHSAARGFPPVWYTAQRLFWVVRRVRLVVEAPARHGDALVCTTRLLGARRIMARRLGTVRRENTGTTVATALVDWIMTRDGTEPTRVPDEMIATFPAMKKAIVPIPLEEPQPPATVAPTPLWVRTSDADAMAHANHTAYLDFLDDAVFRAGGGAAITAHPRTYDLQYHAAARVGAAMCDLAWNEGGVWHYRLATPDGLLILHGRLAASA